MLESKFKSQFKECLEYNFPGILILPGDASAIQGIPDMICFYGSRWFALEFKKSKNASHRPNQGYYVNLMNEMSFARFIYPENADEVLDELQQFLD